MVNENVNGSWDTSMSLDFNKTNLLALRTSSLAKKIANICKAQFRFHQNLNLVISPLYNF